MDVKKEVESILRQYGVEDLDVSVGNFIQDSMLYCELEVEFEKTFNLRQDSVRIFDHQMPYLILQNIQRLLD